MAPSFSNPLGENARSTPLTNSSILTPIIIIVSSAAGISCFMFLGIIAITTYRRVRARQQLAKTKTKDVPRLVITDTSMFPACNLVVNAESDLDKVIASFKPLGTDYHAAEETAVVDVSHASPYDDSSYEQLFPLPKGPRPTCNPEPACEEVSAPSSPQDGKDSRTDLNAGSLSSDRSAYDPTKCSLKLDPTEINEAVWWFDFSGDVSLDSVIAWSDAEKSISSGSLYSTNSTFDVLTSFKHSAHPLSAVNQLDDTESASNKNDHRRETVADYPTGRIGNESQATLYDKDALKYSWRLSDDVSSRARGCSRTSFKKKTAEKDGIRMTSSRSKTVSLPSYASNGAFDQKILEYCWRISDNPSIKSIHDIAFEAPPKLRSTAVARSVSEASVSVPEVTPHSVCPTGYARAARKNGEPERSKSVSRKL